MSRYRILAVLAGLGVAGLVAASAAQLVVSSDDLGAGVTTVASCIDAENDGVNVAYTEVVYNSAIINGVDDPDGGADVKKVTVTPTGTITNFNDCDGQELTLVLTKADGTELGGSSAVIGEDETSIELTITPVVNSYVSAAEVEGVSVLITSEQ